MLELNETIGSMLKMLQRLIGEDIQLRWHPGAGLWPVKIDPSQVDQILANLCVNARDAITDVGMITIETGNRLLDAAFCANRLSFVPGEYVMLAVSDSGCGMDAETLNHIFEPFFTTKGMGKGTGLGLATVYGIVKQNIGFIDVFSQPGQGTTVTIYLPRYLGTGVPLWTPGVQGSVPGGHETVLLVEDEPTMLKPLSMMLERQGYTVLAANAPGEALRLAQSHVGKIHLLITDVVMPEMNGRDLAHKLLSLNPHLRCLFISGYTTDLIAHHGVLDQEVHFLQKPFSMQVLASKVRELLDGVK
ncbi:MAG: ATP-binding protein [Syntrophales bacterium LBB04]|nr:ATP-binding protein [Syntrophales bacterium LBB04]